MTGENTLDRSERDNEIEMNIFLPMKQDGSRVYDAKGEHLFTASSENMATVLVDSFDEALRICMMHPKKMELSGYDN